MVDLKDKKLKDLSKDKLAKDVTSDLLGHAEKLGDKTGFNAKKVLGMIKLLGKNLPANIKNMLIFVFILFILGIYKFIEIIVLIIKVII